MALLLGRKRDYDYLDDSIRPQTNNLQEFGTRVSSLRTNDGLRSSFTACLERLDLSV